MKGDLFLSTTIKRGEDEFDVLVYFECTHYTPGTRHTHPGGHWSKSLGGWLPPDDPEAEFSFLRAEFDGEPGELTEAEIEGLCAWFDTRYSEAMEVYELARPDDGPDPDDARDRERERATGKVT